MTWYHLLYPGPHFFLWLVFWLVQFPCLCLTTVANYNGQQNVVNLASKGVWGWYFLHLAGEPYLAKWMGFSATCIL